MTDVPDNPYDVLGLSRGASQREVQASLARAMKERRHSAKEIAEAQKALLNPRKRLIADYLSPSLPPIRRYRPSKVVVPDQEDAHFNLIPDFIDLELDLARVAADMEPLKVNDYGN